MDKIKTTPQMVRDYKNHLHQAVNSDVFFYCMMCTAAMNHPEAVEDDSACPQCPLNINPQSVWGRDCDRREEHLIDKMDGERTHFYHCSTKESRVARANWIIDHINEKTDCKLPHYDSNGKVKNG